MNSKCIIAAMLLALAIVLSNLTGTASSVEVDNEAKELEQIAAARQLSDNLILSYVEADRSTDANILVASHQRVVARLTAIARKERQQHGILEPRTMAILALGDMAENTGMDVLVPYVEFAPPMVTGETPSLQSNPAVVALWKSGFASIPPILDYLRRQPVEDVSDRAIELYAYIVSGQCKRVVGSRTAATQLVEANIENTSRLYNGNLKRLRDKLKAMESQPETIGQ